MGSALAPAEGREEMHNRLNPEVAEVPELAQGPAACFSPLPRADSVCQAPPPPYTRWTRPACVRKASHPGQTARKEK